MSDNELGTLIRERRETLGLSARKAARQAGLSESLWRQIELGYRKVTADVSVPVNPSARSLRAMSSVLGIDPAPLLKLAGHPQSAGAPVEPADEVDDAVISAILADPHLLPEAKRHLVAQYALLLRVQALEPTMTAAEQREATSRAMLVEIAASPASEQGCVAIEQENRTGTKGP